METYINYRAMSERTAGDKELALELLLMLKDDVENYKEQMLNASFNEDYKTLASLSHKFKSAVAVLGFEKLAEQLAEMDENASKFSKRYEYKSKIISIFISLNNHIVELENYLKE